MSILVTGGKGQVGWEIARLLAQNGIAYYAPDHEELDITDAQAVRQVIGTMPDLQAVIHTAAYTAVDRAETEPGKAFLVNAEGTRTVAKACAERNVPMVYLSTDFVFDGTKRIPYEVADPPNPINVYGKSKLAGEQAVQEILPDKHYIVRTSWVFGPHGNNFPKTILKAAAEGKPLRVVNDQVGSPTYAPDLAEAILTLLGFELTHLKGVQLLHSEKRNAPLQSAPYGIYHVTNAGSCSWYEFAQAIIKLSEYNQPVEPILSSTLAQPAKRPSYSVLSPASAHNVLLMLRPWGNTLKSFFGICI